MTVNEKCYPNTDEEARYRFSYGDGSTVQYSCL